MKKLLLTLLATASIALASGIEYNGTYKCNDVTNPGTYYMLERKDSFVKELKTGYIFNKTLDAVNDYGQPYEIFRRGPLSLQNFTNVNNKYYVNFLIFDNKGYLDRVIELNCLEYN